MSSFMNNYYYGKAGKGDFTEDQLPTNRFQLFFSMLRLHVWGLAGMNLLYILFALPVIMWTMFNVSAMLTSAEAGIEPASVMSGYMLGLVPCMGILGVGLSGIAYVLRNWARDQHTFTMSDFRDSLKANWKQGLLGGLLTGVCLMAAWYCYVFYSQMVSNYSVFFMVPQVMALVLCAVLLLSSMLFYPMMVTYDLKFRHVLRNAVLITLRRLPLSIVVGVLPIALPALIAFYFGGNQYVSLVIALIYMFIGFALTTFIQIAYANACFEKYLNPLIEGAQVNIGMREKEEEEDEEEEEQGE